VYIGRSQYDAPEIDGEVFVANATAKIGDVIPVRITHSFEYDLSGEGVSV
jgi:ribosomal protein S12 methylthiotransferase